MAKMLPIGIFDFKQIITENYYYIDKSLLIKEILENRVAATLIPRPRRFGKTLNMSMVRYFFEKSESDYRYLFVDLAIAQDEKSMAHQGQYPVVFLTLKFVDELTWDECFDRLKRAIAEEFRRHEYLLSSTFLSEVQKEEFRNVIDLIASAVVYELSLKNLIGYLADYHQKRTIVLIDEYDVPMHSGYRNGYFNEVTHFMKSFFGDAFKDNNKLEFALVTGILRVAKESIFSGWNNLRVCTLLSSFYADKFGLLEDEVQQIVFDYAVKTPLSDIRSWYNGYQSGSYTIYNPWSIINLVDTRGSLQPYWINTSTNDIIKKLIKNGDESIKEDIEVLVSRGTITKELCENIVYSDIEIRNDALWNFLFFSGYLTFTQRRLIQNRPHADFLIPNDEIRYLYETTILSWFKEQPGEKIYNQMLQNLLDGDVETFKHLFSHVVQTSFSYFDVSGQKAENFYHAFVLGMMVSLSDRYAVTSSRESGFGRYDVMIIPHNVTKLGIVIEFKKVATYTQETLFEAADNAFAQIEKKNYAHELHARGINNVLMLGIAFAGKQVLINARELFFESRK